MSFKHTAEKNTLDVGRAILSLPRGAHQGRDTQMKKKKKKKGKSERETDRQTEEERGSERETDRQTDRQ